MCKVCKLPPTLVSEIDFKILTHVGYAKISEWLKTKEISISQMTIHRHHSLGHCQQNDRRDAVTPTQTVFDMTADNHSLSRQFLANIYLLHLHLVNEKLSLFQQGIGRYPKNELVGLKQVLDCMSIAVRGGGDSLLKPVVTDPNERIKLAYQSLLESGNPQVVIQAYQSLPPSTIKEDRAQLLKEIREQVYGFTGPIESKEISSFQ